MFDSMQDISLRAAFKDFFRVAFRKFLYFTVIFGLLQQQKQEMINCNNMLRLTDVHIYEDCSYSGWNNMNDFVVFA